MNVIGIVAEYNPFHIGHLHHIQQSCEIVGGDTAVICVMSGDFVQRGEAAIFNKFARAEAAVTGGADLILELPLPWALSSAEGFARGAVGLLGALGCVDYLSFGSECGDLKKLNALATALMDPAVIPGVVEEMKSGISFAAARQMVLEREYGSIAKLLESPNNTLAVEYLRAIFDLHLRLEPITIERKGAGHDEPGGSASDVRQLLAKNEKIKEYVPREVKKIIDREIKAGRGPITPASMENAILSRLRMLGEADFAALPDAGEGLENRLFVAAHFEPTLDGVLAAAKTKRYALSRIRRMCMCAALGIAAGDAEGLPPYARVLAANEKGREALRLIAKKSSFPVITKPASVKELSSECQALFAQGSLAHDLYVLAYKANEEKRGGGDYRMSPVMI